jgi:transposase-like protein
MPPVDRNNPKRSKASESQYSLMEFMREFPDDASCLEWLWRERFASDGHATECPKCERPRRFHKVADRPAWDCDSCGYHLHPLAGTIFHKSSTSLHLWFFAIHLVTSTRCGISAKQLEREIGVTYKTAWRMLNLIRNELMVQDDEPLTGEVEVDETGWGGRPRAGEVARYSDYNGAHWSFLGFARSDIRISTDRPPLPKRRAWTSTWRSALWSSGSRERATSQSCSPTTRIFFLP